MSGQQPGTDAGNDDRRIDAEKHHTGQIAAGPGRLIAAQLKPDRKRNDMFDECTLLFNHIMPDSAGEWTAGAGLGDKTGSVNPAHSFGLKT